MKTAPPSLIAMLARQTFAVSLIAVALSLVIVSLFSRAALEESQQTFAQHWTAHQREHLQHLVQLAMAHARYQQTLAVDGDADARRRAQAATLAWIEQLRIDQDTYVFAGQWDGLHLAGPGRGEHLLDLTDSQGTPIVRNLIARARAGGGFVEYVMPPFPEQRSAPKLSYVEPIAEWEWYVGAGFLVDTMATPLTDLRRSAAARTQLQLITLTLVLALVIALGYLVIQRLTRRAQGGIEEFLGYLDSMTDAGNIAAAPAMDFREFHTIAQAAGAMIHQRQQAEQALLDSERRYRTLVEISQYYIQEIDTDGIIRYANPAALALLGYRPEELIGRSLTELLPEEERERLIADLRAFAANQPEPATYRNRNLTRDGRLIDVEIEWNYKRDDAGRIIGFISVARDITDYLRTRRLLDGRNRVLEMLARGRPMTEMLTAIVDYIERIAPHARCAIHLLDAQQGTLHTAAAPRLPAVYTQSVEGVRIGQGIGSCGTSAATGQRVIVADVMTHPDWVDFRPLMRQIRLRACWSQPILGHLSQVLGTFAIYGDEVMEPSASDIELIESAADLAAIVIEHEHAEKAIREAEERARLLLESSTEGIFGLDDSGRITFINPAAARQLGFTPEELIGQGVHPLIHHSRADGTPLHEERCPMLAAMRLGQPRHAAHEVLWRRDGSHFPAEYWATPIRRDGTVAGAVVTFHDISERRRAEAEMRHLAFHDALTGLPNRLLFREELAQSLARLRRDRRRFALHMLDLDHFKEVNDTLGHPVGDQLLRAVAQRIGSIIRGGDVLARFGGDEFVLLQDPILEVADAALLARKIIDAVSREFQLEGARLSINTSIGIVVADAATHDVDELISRADVALYKAKEAGRGTHAFFEDAMTLELKQDMDVTRELAQAMRAGELRVHYQPQFDLFSGRLVGLEALVRWSHPARGTLPPAEFLYVAEKRGLIRALSDWVLAAACTQSRVWAEQGLPFGRIAVNLCVQQINDPDFAAQVQSVLRHTGARAEHLELDLTEPALLAASERNVAALADLSRQGVSIAIDDFGTGYHSLATLRRLGTGKLKIDRAFVQSLDQAETDPAVLKATIALGHSLALTTLAEGVETETQAASLLRHGCTQAQGFFFAPPEPAEAIAARWLATATDADSGPPAP